MENIIEPRAGETNKVLDIVDEIFQLFDTNEWENFRSLFTDEIDFIVESSTKNISAKYFIDELIDIWKSKVNEVRKSYHILGNKTFEIENELALVFTKTYNFHRLEDSDGKGFWEMWVDYTHSLTKTENGWKCNKIKMAVSSKTDDFNIEEFFPKP